VQQASHAHQVEQHPRAELAGQLRVGGRVDREQHDAATADRVLQHERVGAGA
jgi:hypothetical protein